MNNNKEILKATLFVAGEGVEKSFIKEKLELKASEIQIEKEGQATLKDFAEYLDKDNATYAIALNKSASVTGGIPNLENAEEMYRAEN